ncbi:MAG: hypothetical protein PW792_09485 [Acidobacteriaceae bacterium]|nr:hypothetical protein [Acidobacteriaceae bacterium]
MHRAFLTRPLLALATFFDQPCKIASDSLGCRLQPYLTGLYIVAGILGLVLVAVIAAAIQQYRRNKRTDLKPQ